MARIISIFGLIISILLMYFLPWVGGAFLHAEMGFNWAVNDALFWIYVLCVMVFAVYVVGSQNREKKLTFSVSVLKRRLFSFIFCEMTVFMFGFVVFALNHPEQSVPFVPLGVALFIYKSYLILLIIFLILAVIKSIAVHTKNK